VVNPYKEVNWKPNRDELRAFGKSLIIGFPCVALVMLLTLRWTEGRWIADAPLALAAGGVLAGVVVMLAPPLGRPLYVVWYALACAIGLIIGNLLLALVFYVFVTGIGLFMRLIGRDALRRRLDRQAETYWREAEQPTDPRRYYSQF